MTVERQWAGKAKARERVKATIMSTTKLDPVVGIMVKGRRKQGGGRMPTKASPRLRESPMEVSRSDEVVRGSRKCKYMAARR